jgi:chromosomal replication initiation ATPase DnaA
MSPLATNFEARRQERALGHVLGLVAIRNKLSIEGLKELRSAAAHRFTAMALGRELTGASYPDLARAVGRKDHMSAILGIRADVNRRRRDPRYKAEYEKLRRTAREIVEKL